MRRITSLGMNAGGTIFWMALTVALGLAGAGTWAFLDGQETTDAGARSDLIVDEADSGDAQVALEQEVTSALGEDDPTPEADVTFSFAEEVVRFESGTYLEQDDLFNVTCRSGSGGKEWEHGMDAPLIGAVLVDANDDGPQEFLLVDSRQGVGLDPEGRPIPGFVVNPGVPITAFSMVDYEGTGEERYLFGLADGRILNHRKLGEATPGWRHTSKGAPIQSMAHLRAGRKDYICTVDAAGVVMLLKRNGQRRLRTPVQLHPVSGSRAVAFEVKADIGSSLIISRNEEGQVESRRFDDGVPHAASTAEAQLLDMAEGRLMGAE